MNEIRTIIKLEQMKEIGTMLNEECNETSTIQEMVNAGNRNNADRRMHETSTIQEMMNAGNRNKYKKKQEQFYLTTSLTYIWRLSESSSTLKKNPT